jgi:hypothetical protein
MAARACRISAAVMAEDLHAFFFFAFVVVSESLSSATTLAAQMVNWEGAGATCQ